MLPGSFLRVSKSCIMNTEKIRSVRKNITGASEVEFMDSVKKAFVSRSYFKVLTDKLEEKRLKK
jgi:DNA-binding LytR/AlgR family response regulator